MPSPRINALQKSLALPLTNKPADMAYFREAAITWIMVLNCFLEPKMTSWTLAELGTLKQLLKSISDTIDPNDEGRLGNDFVAHLKEAAEKIEVLENKRRRKKH